MKLSDRAPWIIRTYAGFGDAEASNARFRQNLEKGQRGLSVAFDLPTQNGYDSDHPMAAGEVGGTGVAICSIADMERLFVGIDLGGINTSMTINAPAPWLFALYLVLAERRAVPWTALRGTTQNDLMKEFVARGTYVFDPTTSLRLSTDLLAFATEHAPQWNPMNACGYHYMESGATPVEEVGMAIGNAMLILDALRPRLDTARFRDVVRRMSFFINSGIELVSEISKVRAYSQLWKQVAAEEYGVTDAVFRAGCQVRSLTLTAQSPEVNIVRIAYEALPVVLSASARVGALQLPGFREALSLPDEAEQTLALRTQQVLMYETDITQYGDIFEGSIVIEGRTAEILQGARGLAYELRELGYGRAITRVTEALTGGLLRWKTAIERGDVVQVGVNAFQTPVNLVPPAPRGNPAAADGGSPQDPSAAAVETHLARLREHRATRDHTAVSQALHALKAAYAAGESIMPASLALARAGGTTGEWTQCIEDAGGGRYTASLGVEGAANIALDVPKAPRRIRVVLGKSGLDGHVNAVKLIAVALARAGMEVIYTGIKQPPATIADTAIQEDADIIGISSLSGSHLHIARATLARLKERGASDIPVIMGGILPDEDLDALKALGVAATFTPGAESMAQIVERIVALVGD